MFTQWKVTSALYLLLPVLVLCGLTTSCAPTLVSPTDPNSSLVIGRIVINNKHIGRRRGLLPLGTVDQGIEVEVESGDGKQYFKVTTEEQGYFFIPNIPPSRYQVRSAQFEGTKGREYEWYSMRLRKFNFAPVPGKITYIGTLFIELSERARKKIRQVREGENARAYFHQKYADSKWASREFTTTGEIVERIGGGVNCGDVQILSVELGAREAERYCRYAVGERKKVEAFWGATWKQPIRIHVDSSYRISRALGPAYRGNRGFMEMPLRGGQRKGGALLHEIVHIYAPNDNRFLAEGVATYLQDKLGGNPAPPNFGRDLHLLARERLSDISSLDILNAVRTPDRIGRFAGGPRGARIFAGSFVSFLIEKYGLPKFRKLYATEDYDKVFGKSVRTLEEEWRTSISG